MDEADEALKTLRFKGFMNNKVMSNWTSIYRNVNDMHHMKNIKKGMKTRKNIRK